MVARRFLAVACLCFFGLPAAAPSSARADIIINWTNQATAGFDALETNLINYAISQWQYHVASFGPNLGGRTSFNIDVNKVQNTVGNASSGLVDAFGFPNLGIINMGSSTAPPVLARGGFFYDPTPWETSEYLPTSTPNYFVAVPGGPADGKLDFFNVILHEIGHTLGYLGYPAWDAALDPLDPTLLNYGNGRAARLDVGVHLAFVPGQEWALMNSSSTLPTRGSGDRRYLSQLDLDVLAGVYGFEVRQATFPAASAVPEPASLILVGSLAVAALGYRRRVRSPISAV